MQPYQLVSLHHTKEIPQLNSLPGKWYRYEISNGINPITGYRCGSMAEVREYVYANIKRLNQKFDIKRASELFHKPYLKPCYITDAARYS